METLIARRLRIRGRVQGVGYRDAMRREAERLGVSGWVKNCADGSVEAMLHGPVPDVEAVTTWAERGPQFARVDQVEVLPCHASPASSGFVIRRD